MQKVAIYNSRRVPKSWVDMLLPGQVAVFLHQVDTSVTLDDNGEPVLEYAKQSCYFFDDLGEAKRYCNDLVTRKDHIRCEIYDERGLAVEPIYTILNSRHEHRLSNRKTVRRFIVASIVVTLSSIPLFWYDWKAQGARIWPTVIGINLIVLGLRFLYWGYGELEHIRHLENEQRLAETKSGLKA